MKKCNTNIVIGKDKNGRDVTEKCDTNLKDNADYCPSCGAGWFNEYRRYRAAEKTSKLI